MPQAFFPPLDKIITGEQPLISWKTAYRALCNPERALEETSLESFLSDNDSIHYLSNAIDPFYTPSEKGRSDFESKTAPINVSQSSNGDYNIEELKKDTLWLSKQLQLEELYALRVVLLEWQRRAEDELQAVAAADVRTGPSLDFATEDVRRERQIAIYLEEKSHILLISATFAGQISAQNGKSKTTRSWLDEIAHTVTQNQFVALDEASHTSFCSACIDAIDAWVQSSSNNSKLPKDLKSEHAIQLLYLAALFRDITSALRLLLANLYTFDRIPNSKTVSSWFKVMQNVEFFRTLAPSPVLPDPSVLQGLASIVSVAILDLPRVLTDILDSMVRGQQDTVYPELPTDSYIYNISTVSEVNLILYHAARETIVIASPAIFAWSIITAVIQAIAKEQHDTREQKRIDDGSDDGEPLIRRASSRQLSKDDGTIFERQLQGIRDFELESDVRENPNEFFARAAVEVMNVYSIIVQLCSLVSTVFGSATDMETSFLCRFALLELVRAGISKVTYGPEVLECVVTLLSPNPRDQSTTLDHLLVDRFLSDGDDDGVFRHAVLEQAIARYPYELMPMARLLNTLSSASGIHANDIFDAAALLESLQLLTVMVPEHFRSYTLDHEDENMNSMVLTESLPLFVSKQAVSIYGLDFFGRAMLTMGSSENQGSSVLAVPTGATGVVVKESRPLVLTLDHSHSGLEYLGLLLSTLLPNSQLVPAPMVYSLDRSTAAEMIALTTTLLRQSMVQRQTSEEAQFVLERLSAALQDEQDIMIIIADIFELELLSFLDQSTQEGSLDLVIACAEFLDKLTDVYPERVWSTLSRSSLLGISGGANALVAVVAGGEVNQGRHRFLSACVSMYSHLITHAITGLVKRKAKVNKTANRFDSPISFQDTTPERTMSAVLDAYQMVMIDAWESLGESRLEYSVERCEITVSLLRSFERLLLSTYGIGSGEDGMSALLHPSATALLDTFAPEKGNGTTLQSFSSIFPAGLATQDVNMPSPHRQSLLQQTIAAADFLTHLIRVTSMLDETGKRAYSLASQLTASMPVFASLLAIDQSLKPSICLLLTEVVKTINKTSSDPPSLLGQLDITSAKAFLGAISQLDSPLRDVETERTVWGFLSAVMSCRQQWFAIYLLTGTIPKDRLKEGSTKTDESKTKSLLAHALDQLSDLDTLPPERAIAMLDFVTSAQKNWIWATNEILSHSDFLKNALGWLNSLEPPKRVPNIAEELILASEHQTVAYLCDILAVNVQTSNEISDKAILKTLTPKITFLRRHGADVNAYKRSLHRNLSDNFSKKFPSCAVADFRRSTANPAPFGRKFFYDVELAEKVLGHERAWHGTGTGRNQGFSDEFARANVNLSLVEAEVRQLKSWRVLVTVLCESLDQDAALQTELTKTAERCLSANVEANLEQPGMDEVIKTRAGMAFVIVSKLVAIKSSEPVMKTLLSSAWNLVRSSPVDYEIATAAEDLAYYRTLLQMLYLAIQPHAYMKSDPAKQAQTPNATNETVIELLDPTVAACFVQILEKVIAPGFRALCGNLHKGVELAQPGDFAILTALLQAIVSVPGVSAVHHQLADVAASTSLVRGALSLYSWSDRLAEAMEQDPIYGEVAIMFLLSLSSIPPLAEQMALEGVLVQLSSANLSNYFRKPEGKTPFSEPRRMFVIWTEGFLPLCLNLLDSVGPPVAGDVATFLNSFSHQLQRANQSLENREATRQNPYANAITLGLVSEARSLCLIGLILASDRARGAAEGIDGADVPPLEFEYEKVREDVAGLMRQRTSLASRVVPVGEREEEWSRAGAGLPSDNVLLGKIVKEIKELLRCFGREE